MSMQIKEGWLQGKGIRRLESTNCDQRPFVPSDPFGAIRLLVIHNISLPPGQYGGCYVDQLFTNCLNPVEHVYFEAIANIKVSAHLFIDRQGKVTQYVSFHDRAWHAGRSSFQGKENCNDFSIGIELEGTDDEAYADVQYHQLARLTGLIMREYPGITQDNIVGHRDIAPDRKTDPGDSFNWKYYRSLIGVI